MEGRSCKSPLNPIKSTSKSPLGCILYLAHRRTAPSWLATPQATSPSCSILSFFCILSCNVCSSYLQAYPLQILMQYCVYWLNSISRRTQHLFILLLLNTKVTKCSGEGIYFAAKSGRRSAPDHKIPH